MLRGNCCRGIQVKRVFARLQVDHGRGLERVEWRPGLDRHSWVDPVLVGRRASCRPARQLRGWRQRPGRSDKFTDNRICTPATRHVDVVPVTPAQRRQDVEGCDCGQQGVCAQTISPFAGLNLCCTANVTVREIISLSFDRTSVPFKHS